MLADSTFYNVKKWNPPIPAHCVLKQGLRQRDQQTAPLLCILELRYLWRGVHGILYPLFAKEHHTSFSAFHEMVRHLFTIFFIPEMCMQPFTSNFSFKPPSPPITFIIMHKSYYSHRHDEQTEHTGDGKQKQAPAHHSSTRESQPR
jgi:hypothetical protein